MGCAILQSGKLLGEKLVQAIQGYLEGIWFYQCHRLHGLSRVRELASVNQAVLTTDVLNALDFGISLLGDVPVSNLAQE